MKKLLVLALTVVMILALAACGSPTEEQPEEQIDYEIAMVTDSGLIMDGGYSEAAWTAISGFGAENGVSHKYYKAAEATEEAYRTAINDAVSKGAKVVITDGFSFEDIIYDMQNEHKDVKFILIDAEPMDPETGKPKIGENTAALLFSCEEAGYLAGFAAVENGESQLGFIGEADQPIYTDFGYGFLQGANAAAVNNGIIVDVEYHSCDGDCDRDDVVEMSEDWYEGGIEAIFACGDHVEKAVIAAAEMRNGKVIACETDKSSMSDTVMTSAEKDIEGVIRDVLSDYLKNKFPGGEVIEFDVATDSIWLDMETSRFTNFVENDYKNLYKQLKNKSIDVKDHSVGKISELSLSNVRVDEK